MSVQSMNSVNLERINQRNADRLAKLENNDFIDDSANMTMNSIRSRAQIPSRQSNLLHQPSELSRDQPIPIGLSKSITIPEVVQSH